jgi:hypothetical protein
MLTDDDKQWILEQQRNLLGEFQNWTRQELERFAETLQRFATKEDLEQVETRLLTEFHKWASPMEMRQRTHAAALRAIDLEMEAISDRVEKLEHPGSQQGH